jgi:tetratricopeptide (TPR) repeat protein
VSAPVPETAAAGPEAPPEAEPLPPPPPPRERPRAPAAKLSPASQALVNQAQAQRKKGDLPGATVSLDRALRIEPNNPLLWIEMGRLRMDQRNYPQAENMGRKALSMSVGDDRTQAMAWQLIADSYRARGKNAQAQEALEKSKMLSAR